MSIFGLDRAERSSILSPMIKINAVQQVLYSNFLLLVELHWKMLALKFCNITVPENYDGRSLPRLISQDT